MDTLQTEREAAAQQRIAIIDLGPYLGGEAGALERTAAALGEASETLGFYFIRNHGVPQSLIDRVFAAAERFHTLPLDRKMAVKCLEKVVGYLPLGGQTQRLIYKGGKHPDRSASFYIKAEYPPDHPYRRAKHEWVFDNRWPEDLPGFRETCLEYFAAMTALALKLLPLQSLALGMPVDHFSRHEAFNPGVNTLRLLCYPPRDEALDGQFGISPHTDYGFMTLLAQAKKPGLEIATTDGQWIEAPALDGCFLVNHADMCRRWTNDRFRSAPHRVTNLHGETRYSIPFFVGTRWDVKLECLPTCRGPGHPPRYPAMSFGEYMAELTPKIYDALKQQTD
ncbi:MAG TPA: 2OG-Fe(II) oxygenase family protein [Stellaceae bacterium]|nr:2OG-Fe(II) oxygenase family protein [Stellaceae bacterium]